MTKKRLSMRKIRELLRLKYEFKLANRDIGRSLKISPATVSYCLQRANNAGVIWPIDDGLDDAQLENLLYPCPGNSYGVELHKPDGEYIRGELQKKGVTLQLLWDEYKKAHGNDGYQYSQYCEYYRRYRQQLDCVFHHDYKAGEKLFVDYSGDGFEITNRETGEISRAELFVAVLGASDFIYAEAPPTQELSCWIMAHCHA